MKRFVLILISLFFVVTLGFSGCAQSSDGNSENEINATQKNSVSDESTAEDRAVSDKQISSTKKTEPGSDKNKTTESSDKGKVTTNKTTSAKAKSNSAKITTTANKTTTKKVTTTKKKTTTKKASTTKKKITTTKKVSHCTNNNNHSLPCGDMGRWFGSKGDVKSYVENIGAKWWDKYENGEITREEYIKNCPGGYECWSCSYCGKWTGNFKYR